MLAAGFLDTLVRVWPYGVAASSAAFSAVFSTVASAHAVLDKPWATPRDKALRCAG